jgi:predicted DNA binding protein
MPKAVHKKSREMMEAVLSVKGLRCWASEVAQGRSAVIRVLDTKRRGPKGMTHNWVELLSSTTDEAELVREIRGHNEVSSVDVVSVKEGSVGLVKTKMCPAAAAMSGLNCRVKSHIVRPDGTSELTVQAMGRLTLRRLIERLQRAGADVAVDDVGQARQNPGLSAVQERALQLALASGYLEYPRRIRQRELAKLCGISSSTLAETLRRAEKEVVGEYFNPVRKGSAKPPFGEA